ncbi:MAG: AAA family ATPase [Bacteroidota bacterium]
MQAIILIGIQATGKSSFYKENFFNSHIRISLDLFNTRNKENQFLEKCFELHASVVIDNTNPRVEDRQRYIKMAKANKYQVVGYYFQSKPKDALARNAKREGKARIPDAGVLSCYSKLELPNYGEGFNELFYVSIEDGDFKVSNWKNEV